MKKVLSIVLAVMMLSTMAFAAIDVADDGLQMYPGASLKIPADKTIYKAVDSTTGNLIAITTEMDAYKVNAKEAIKEKNWTVSKVSWDSGRTLVKSVAIDDKITDGTDKVGGVKITLKEDYKLVKESDLEGTVFLKEKTAADSTIGKVTIALEVKKVVYNNEAKIILDSRDDEESLDEDQVANTVYTVDAANGSGNLTLTGDDFEFSNKVYDGEKLFLEWDYEFDDAVLQANDDVTGDITFLNFVASPSFSSGNGKFIFDVEKDYHIYENKDGKLTELKAKWSDDDNGLVVTGIKTLGSYVISEKALKSVAASAGETPTDNSNPDTGANDIVGIATALAAVALVSAAAVSLKK